MGNDMTLKEAILRSQDEIKKYKEINPYSEFNFLQVSNLKVCKEKGFFND